MCVATKRRLQGRAAALLLLCGWHFHYFLLYLYAAKIFLQFCRYLFSWLACNSGITATKTKQNMQCTFYLVIVALIIPIEISPPNLIKSPPISNNTPVISPAKKHQPRTIDPAHTCLSMRSLRKEYLNSAW